MLAILLPPAAGGRETHTSLAESRRSLLFGRKGILRHFASVSPGGGCQERFESRIAIDRSFRTNNFGAVGDGIANDSQTDRQRPREMKWYSWKLAAR
jgi:hypothetical protein